MPDVDDLPDLIRIAVDRAERDVRPGEAPSEMWVKRFTAHLMENFNDED